MKFAAAVMSLASFVFAQEEFRPDPYTTFDPRYKLCDDTRTPVSKIVGSDAGILPLKLTPYAASKKYQISGSVIISSGCKFDVTGFTYSGGNESFWFGSYQEGDNQGMILSRTPVFATNFRNMTNTPENRTFDFITTNGQQVNYGGFNQFRLYTKDQPDPVFVAFADIPLEYTPARPSKKTSAINPASGLQSLQSGSLQSVLAPLLIAATFFCNFA